VPRTLLDRSVAGIGRLAVRGSEDVERQSLTVGDWMLAQLGVPSAPGVPGDEPAAGSATESAPAGGEEAATAMSTDAADEAFAAGSGEEPVAASDSLLVGDGSSGALGPGDAAAGPAQPPTPVPWSPSALVSIREQRTDIASAMEVVNDYIGETVDAERHNVGRPRCGRHAGAAQCRAAELCRCRAGDGGCGAGQTRSGFGLAAGNVGAGGGEASGDAARGQQQADGVQSEGQGVSVEPKPEEPRSRSWLERAWDATAGALWDGLVAPAVRAVRRKVNEVMQSINEFIMGMINQALGLDEIEAELDGGGQDIERAAAASTKPIPVWKRSASRRVEEQERNRQSMAQAEANIDDSRATREDALALQGDLAAHDERPGGRGNGGTDATSSTSRRRYRPYFDAMREGGGAGEPTRGAAGRKWTLTQEQNRAGGSSSVAAEEEESDESALVA
jgi:hypothetical protein